MKIKIYNKFELAWLDYPLQSKHVAVNHLMRLINHCTPLVTALRNEGYHPRDKTFSLRMVMLTLRVSGRAIRGLTTLKPYSEKWFRPFR